MHTCVDFEFGVTTAVRYLFYFPINYMHIPFLKLILFVSSSTDAGGQSKIHFALVLFFVTILSCGDCRGEHKPVTHHSVHG